jgi:hypothetical protein
MAFADTRVIFLEDDIQAPVQRVLNAPVNTTSIGKVEKTGINKPPTFNLQFSAGEWGKGGPKPIDPANPPPAANGPNHPGSDR